MDNVVGYNRRGAISNASMGSGGGGGDVDDILKRLGNVESQVSSILAVIPHLATKADVADFKAAVNADFGDVRAGMASMETRIIKWIVATVLASATLAFTIAKFVH
jgi:hypothetical protein